MFFGIGGLVVLVLDIIAIMRVLQGKGSSGYKVLWVLLILLLPVVGMILYFLLGDEKGV